MGKKSKNVQKAKGDKKELQAITRRIKVNLHKQLQGVQLKKKIKKNKKKTMKKWMKMMN